VAETQTPDDDAQLAARLAAGSEGAFAELYRRFGPRLYRTALGLLGRREDAEDALQDVFAALVRSRHRLCDVRDLAAYLFASLRRQALRRARLAISPNTAASRYRYALERLREQLQCTRKSQP
jgi:RNA polymerase sigma-70 factor (ECF subfamily)